jgi:hypothetical protein
MSKKQKNQDWKNLYHHSKKNSRPYERYLSLLSNYLILKIVLKVLYI